MSFNLITGRKGTEHVTSKQFRDIIRAFAGKGTYIPNVNDNLEIVRTSTNSITVRAGILIHHGCVFEIPYGDSMTFTIDTPTEGVNKRYYISVTWQIQNGIESATLTCALDDDPDYSFGQGNMQELDDYDNVVLAGIDVRGTEVTIMRNEDLMSYGNIVQDAHASMIATESVDEAPVLGADVILPEGDYIILGNVTFQTAITVSNPRNMQIAIYVWPKDGRPLTPIRHSYQRMQSPNGAYARMQTMAIGHFEAGMYSVGATANSPTSQMCDFEIIAMRIR